jgi:prepilin-type N-terminal cleavage/methylation domain-containing protein
MKSYIYNDGFTLIELIMVIILVGILAVSVIPNLNIVNFKETGGFQQGIAMVRFGQKLAITSGCDVVVSLSSSTCTLTFSGCTGASIPNPSSGSNNFCSNSDPGVSPAVNFTFNNIGAPTAGVQTINFSGGQVVTVEANTGFVHE